MRMFGRTVALAVALTGATAFADANDFRIFQLGNPSAGAARFNPEANAQFRVFARELGAALSSVNLMPPETLGHSAFAVNAELSVVSLDTGSFTLPTEELLRGGQTSAGTLLVPSVHLRKGLPYSFELGGRLGWIEKSRMAVATGEVKWALNEGFTYLPDIGIRGHVTRLLNSRDFDLYVVGVDLGLGHQFAIGGMLTLTPYVGFNPVWVGATSGTVDFRPERTHEESIASPTAQLNDVAPFQEVQLTQNRHSRLYGGLRFIGGVVQLGAEVSLSNLGNFTDATTGQTVSMPSVLAFNATFGLDF